MANKHNANNSKNDYPVEITGGSSFVNEKLKALEADFRKELRAKYGNLNQFSTAQLNEMIKLHFGDDPIGELLREIDPTGYALRFMYGEPLKRMSY